MSSRANITHLKRAEIDAAKWDACIDASPNGLVYAYSWYLDAMCDQWDALVLDDYAAVMPIPWRKKWGIKYVYQAPFIQKLGIFDKKSVRFSEANFFDILSQQFVFFNFDSIQRFTYKDGTVTPRSNYIINLDQSNREIELNFTKEAVKNLRKAHKRGCNLINHVPVSDVISMYQNAYGKLQPSITEPIYSRFEKFGSTLIKNGKAQTYGVIDNHGILVYSSLILLDNRRIYYLMGAPTEKGRTMRATYFFIKQILETFSNQPLLFDFEGSDIPEVAAFYRRFGPEEEQYYNIKNSKLSSLEKLLGKLCKK